MSSLKIRQIPIFISNFNQLKRDHRNLKLLKKAVEHLANRDLEILTRVYKDHALQGTLKQYRELRITSDWFLFYTIIAKELILLSTALDAQNEFFSEQYTNKLPLY